MASRGSFDALDAKGLKRGRRAACDELLGMKTSRYDGACCWMSTVALAPPREVSKVGRSASYSSNIAVGSCWLQSAESCYMLHVACCMRTVGLAKKGSLALPLCTPKAENVQGRLKASNAQMHVCYYAVVTRPCPALSTHESLVHVACCCIYFEVHPYGRK